MIEFIKELIEIKHKVSDLYQIVQDFDNIKSKQLKDLCKETESKIYRDIEHSITSLAEKIGKSPEFRTALVIQKQNEANEAFKKVQKQFGFPDPLDQVSILKFNEARERYQDCARQIMNQLNSDVDVKMEMKRYGFVDIDDKQSLSDRETNAKLDASINNDPIENDHITMISSDYDFDEDNELSVLPTAVEIKDKDLTVDKQISEVNEEKKRQKKVKRNKKQTKKGK